MTKKSNNMENPNNMSSPNTSSCIEKVHSENLLEITQVTEFKRPIVNMNKDFNKFKEHKSK